MAKVAIPPKVSMKKDNIANENKISITKNGVKTNNMTKNIIFKCFKKGNDGKTEIFSAVIISIQLLLSLFGIFGLTGIVINDSIILLFRYLLFRSLFLNFAPAWLGLNPHTLIDSLVLPSFPFLTLRSTYSFFPPISNRTLHLLSPCCSPITNNLVINILVRE